MVNKTNALNEGISSIVRRYKDEKTIDSNLMLLFALGGSTYGMGKKRLHSILLIPVMMGVGFDSLLAVAIALVGSQVGCLASTVNPFATGVASQTLNISPGDGLVSRVILLIITITISIIYVYHYASVIEKDPTKSLVYNQRAEDEKHFLVKADPNDDYKMTGRQKTVIWLFGITFVVMILGLIPWSNLNSHWTFLINLQSGWLIFHS